MLGGIASPTQGPLSRTMAESERGGVLLACFTLVGNGDSGGCFRIDSMEANSHIDEPTVSGSKSFLPNTTEHGKSTEILYTPGGALVVQNFETVETCFQNTQPGSSADQSSSSQSAYSTYPEPLNEGDYPMYSPLCRVLSVSGSGIVQGKVPWGTWSLAPQWSRIVFGIRDTKIEHTLITDAPCSLEGPFQAACFQYEFTIESPKSPHVFSGCVAIAPERFGLVLPDAFYDKILPSLEGMEWYETAVSVSHTEGNGGAVVAKYAYLDVFRPDANQERAKRVSRGGHPPIVRPYRSLFPRMTDSEKDANKSGCAILGFSHENVVVTVESDAHRSGHLYIATALSRTDWKDTLYLIVFFFAAALEIVDLLHADSPGIAFCPSTYLYTQRMAQKPGYILRPTFMLLLAISYLLVEMIDFKNNGRRTTFQYTSSPVFESPALIEHLLSSPLILLFAMYSWRERTVVPGTGRDGIRRSIELSFLSLMARAVVLYMVMIRTLFAFSTSLFIVVGTMVCLSLFIKISIALTHLTLFVVLENVPICSDALLLYLHMYIWWIYMIYQCGTCYQYVVLSFFPVSTPGTAFLLSATILFGLLSIVVVSILGMSLQSVRAYAKRMKHA